jgi:hypothetical protein
MVPPALLQAQRPPQPPPFPILALSRELGLREDQRQSLHALLEQRRERMRAAHDRAEQAREAFRRTMVDVSKSQADLDAALRQASEAHRQEAQEAHALLQEAAKLLTPEQRAAYQRLAATLPPPPPPPRERGEGGEGWPGPRGSRGERPDGPPPERP